MTRLERLNHLVKSTLSWEVQRNFDLDNFLSVELFDGLAFTYVKSNKRFGQHKCDNFVLVTVLNDWYATEANVINLLQHLSGHLSRKLKEEIKFGR